MNYNENLYDEYVKLFINTYISLGINAYTHTHTQITYFGVDYIVDIFIIFIIYICVCVCVSIYIYII